MFVRYEWIFRYINKGERYYHTRPTIKCKSFQVNGIRNKYQPPGIEPLAGVEINESSLSRAGWIFVCVISKRLDRERTIGISMSQRLERGLDRPWFYFPLLISIFFLFFYLFIFFLIYVLDNLLVLLPCRGFS